MRLVGKRAFVTGGSRGIGNAIVKALAKEGASVAFTWLHSAFSAERLLTDLPKEHDQRHLSLRAGSEDSDSLLHGLKAANAEFGGIDILINNAGAFHYGDITELTPEEIDLAIHVNCRAPLIAIREALPKMPRGGRIVSIGTSLVDRVPAPGFALYSMTKASLVGMTKALARDLGPRDITVNLVNPGSTDTEMNPANAEHADTERALTALGRDADPADIAAAVLFLVGPHARHITGTSVNVDGGATA